MAWFHGNVGEVRVRNGFIFAILFLVLAEPSKLTMLQGLAVAVFGELIRTWSSGVIVKNNELSKTGPFSMVRNPLYVGSFIMGLGVAIMSGSRFLVVLFILFFFSVYSALVKMEEKYLLGRYGEDFLAYCRQVPRFFPDLRNFPPVPAMYDLKRMLYKHKEWQAWLGLFGVIAYLLFAHRYWTHTTLLGNFLRSIFGG